MDQNVVLFGFSGVTIIFYATQEARGFGIEGKGLRLVALLAAIFVATVFETSKLWPAIVGPWAEGVIITLGLAVGAKGLYESSKTGQDPAPVVNVVNTLPPATSEPTKPVEAVAPIVTGVE